MKEEITKAILELYDEFEIYVEEGAKAYNRSASFDDFSFQMFIMWLKEKD